VYDGFWAPGADDLAADAQRGEFWQRDRRSITITIRKVEFLQLGLSNNGPHTLKVYGPDRSGVYGGAQGEGGLENSIDETAGFGYISLNQLLRGCAGGELRAEFGQSGLLLHLRFGSVLGG